MFQKSAPKPDAEQCAAIRAFRGAYRVDACAGAGKTSTLVGRLKFLIAQGVPESEILALTFTRTAAEEMRTKAKAEKETLRTLHSWALSVVKQEVAAFTPPLRAFPLLLGQFEIVMPLAKHLSIQYKDLTSYISNCKRQGKSPEQMHDDAENDEQRRYAEAYGSYQGSCHRMGVMDFDSIIWELVLLLEKRPDVAARHQIKYLMVDEAQDCSEMDWRMIRVITREHGNVWIVGDFAQSVYGFRGASPEIFANFDALFPGAITLPMGTNYRSQANVVKYSQEVMPEITSYLNNWKAFKPPTTLPLFQRFNNDGDEARWIINKVVAGHCELNETAVLARTNAQLAIMQGFCAEQGIAYKLLGKDNFWKRPEVLGLLGLIRNAAWADDGALKQALKSPLPCVKFLRKDDAIEALERFQAGKVGGANGEPPSLKSLLTTIDTGDYRQNEVLRGVASLLEGAKKMTTPFAMANYLAEKSGARMLGDDDDDKKDNFIQDNIGKIVTMSKIFDNLKDFIKFARTAGHPSRKQTRLLLSTVHGFKGREAKNVFVIGVNLGVFPHDRADLQEEKRLYYVAVSRPTENLFVSCACSPSLFIEHKVPKEDVVVPDKVAPKGTIDFFGGATA